MRILDSAIDEMREGSLGALTIAKVAERAKITERTVYRHFQTREDLLKAVWPRMQARVGSSGFPQTAGELIATPLRLFPRFDEEDGLVRASISSETGREVRLSSNEQRQSAMLACVTDALPNFGGPAKRRRAARRSVPGIEGVSFDAELFCGRHGRMRRDRRLHQRRNEEKRDRGAQTFASCVRLCCLCCRS